MNEKILQGILIAIIILGSGYLVYSFVVPTSETPEAVEESTEPTNNCGEKPEFSEFLGIDPEEMQFYRPSQQELDAFNALLKEWNNCVETLDWQTYRNEELGFQASFPKNIEGLSVEVRVSSGPMSSDASIDKYAIIDAWIVGTQENVWLVHIYSIRPDIQAEEQIEEIIDFWLDPNEFEANLEAIEIGGKIGFLVTTQRPPQEQVPGSTLEYVYVIQRDKIYRLSALELEAFISTFEFIEPVVEVDTSNWVEYRNEKFGFTFKYPPEFFNSTEYEDEGIELLGNTPGVERMVVGYYEPYEGDIIQTEEITGIITWAGELRWSHLIRETENPKLYHFYKEKGSFIDEDIFIIDDKTGNAVIFLIERTTDALLPVDQIVQTLRF